ncbi:MAG: 30S ribosomal protein S6 [Candidatus Dasytiphilus stammeri]
MHHYEIIFMVHPDQSEKITEIINHYSNMIINNQGKIHRLENWGRRQLAYPIKKLHKAHYILMNVEITEVIRNELVNNFRYNDAIIRTLIIKVKSAISESSPLISTEEKRDIVVSSSHNKDTSISIEA